MSKFKIGIACFLTILLFLVISGCGHEKVAIPSVGATTPAPGATNVAINTAINATFNVEMKASSINATTFTLTGPGGIAVAGSVTYSSTGSIATFTPNANLAYDTVYSATITSGATNPGGTGLISNYVWSFTTILAPPAVLATTPANGAVNVPINQILSVTFSEVMNCATLTSPATNFTLTGPGSTPVAGTVTCVGSVATFTPTLPLAYSTVYTATISTGATNLIGEGLLSNYIWNFTTITPPPMVISTVPVSGATAVLITQVLSATFNEAMNCATLSSPATTFTVTGPGLTPIPGTVSCSGAVASFTPTNKLPSTSLITATISTAAKSLAGTPMAANYVWSFISDGASTPPTVIATVPVNGATGVPINQSMLATFNVAMNPSTLNTTTFTVTGPGSVAVTGVVTYVAAGSVATFNPVVDLAPSTLYTATITTGVKDLSGAALASNYVWSFTTAAAPFITPPTVISTVPASGATSVPVNQIVSATFSKAMNPTTINSSNFTLVASGGGAVAGLVAYAAVSDTLTFTPTANLAASTVYTATITTGVKDLTGNAMAATYVWSFTTGSSANNNQPVLVSTIPVNTTTGIPINESVSGTFSEAMNPLTITTATFQLTGPGGVLVPATVAYDSLNFIATLTPITPLAANTSYTASITGATSLAGNTLSNTGAPNPWTFSTGTGLIPPIVQLGTSALFGAFGGNTGITNQGISTLINGDIGTTAASTTIVGFNDSGPGCTYSETGSSVGFVNGSIYTAAPSPSLACPLEGTSITSAIASRAAADALTAYNTLTSFTGGLDVSTCAGCGGGLAGELGGRILSPGIYKSVPGAYGITLGDLTLNALGNPNAYWVFQMSSSLTIGTPTAHRSVLLVNGAKAENVFWQVGSSATINGIQGGGVVSGTILAQTAISVSTTGVAAITTLNGRFLSLTGPITMDNTIVNVPAP